MHVSILFLTICRDVPKTPKQRGKLQNKTHSKGGQWLWHNKQFRYFREFVKRQRHLHVLQKRQRHLQPLVQRHRSGKRRDKATRLPPLEGLIHRVVTRYIFSWLIPFFHPKFWSLIPKSLENLIPDPAKICRSHVRQTLKVIFLWCQFQHLT